MKTGLTMQDRVSLFPFCDPFYLPHAWLDNPLRSGTKEDPLPIWLHHISLFLFSWDRNHFAFSNFVSQERFSSCPTVRVIVRVHCDSTSKLRLLHLKHLLPKVLSEVCSGPCVGSRVLAVQLCLPSGPPSQRRSKVNWVIWKSFQAISWPIPNSAGPLSTCRGPLWRFDFFNPRIDMARYESPDTTSAEDFFTLQFCAAKFKTKIWSHLTMMYYFVNLSTPHFPDLFRAPRGQSFNSSAVHPSILLPLFLLQSPLA